MNIKSLLVLLIIPVEMILQAYMKSNGLINKYPVGVLLVLLISLIGLVILIKIRGEVYKKDWDEYKRNKKDWLISILAWLGGVFLISLSNKLMGVTGGSASSISVESDSNMDYMMSTG